MAKPSFAKCNAQGMIKKLEKREKLRPLHERGIQQDENLTTKFTLGQRE